MKIQKKEIQENKFYVSLSDDRSIGSLFLQIQTQFCSNFLINKEEARKW